MWWESKNQITGPLVTFNIGNFWISGYWSFYIGRSKSRPPHMWIFPTNSQNPLNINNCDNSVGFFFPKLVKFELNKIFLFLKSTFKGMTFHRYWIEKKNPILILQLFTLREFEIFFGNFCMTRSLGIMLYRSVRTSKLIVASKKR